MNVVAPSGVVTFLFTDIEGSTRRWEADADTMRTALADHDDILREIVAAHQGWAFRWSADQGDIDTAATIAFYAGVLGVLAEQYEPVTWAAELIEPAAAADHRRLAQLYMIASECHAVGRIDDAVRFADNGLIATGSGRFDEIPFGLEAAIVAVYSMVGHPEVAVIPLRKMIARTPGTHILERSCLVLALVNARAGGEARAEAEGLLAAAETTDAPNAKSLALTAYSWAFHDADPACSYDVGLRALKIAQDSGCRYLESVIALGLSRLAGGRRDPAEAFDFLTIAIRNYHDSGRFLLMHGPLAILGTILDRLGNYQSAATLVGFAADAATLQGFPELHTAIAHLREVLGDEIFKSLARAGEHMTTAAIVAYAFEQIEQGRVAL